VTIRLRAALEDNLVPYLVSDGFSRQMVKIYVEESFCFYCAEVKLAADRFNYHFEIISEGKTWYYDRYGLCDRLRPEYSFSILPGFSVPSWAKGAVMYQIYVDRFFNGDTSNDVETNEYSYIRGGVTKVEDWNKVPANFGVGEFYGGDLEGVRQKLYYLKSIGVEVIYFNPLFVSPSNHGYDIADYDYIDPHFTVIPKDGGECLNPGDNDNRHAIKYKQRVTNLANLEASNEYFAKFVEEAHAKGIKIILDGVFNHCGSFNKWLNREGIYESSEGYAPGAFESASSPYRSYFKFADNSIDENNHTYEGWWGYDTLPKLNFEDSPELYDYVMRIAKKWVSAPYNCDGWRLDVAADLGHSEEFNHKFWKDFRKAVKEANPDAIILAEHYGDASSWLKGDQWDTIMNYDAFMEPLTYLLTGMEKHSDEYHPESVSDGVRFRDTMLHHMSTLMTPSLYCSMNQLSNHDHSRFLTRTNHKAGRVDKLGAAAAAEGVNVSVFKLAALGQMTWPGAPTLYYGDEAGQVGFTDPDNRRTYPWDTADYELISFHRDVIALHKYSPAIRKGSFMFLDCGKGYISYSRFVQDEKYIIIINTSDKVIERSFSIWQSGIPKDTRLTQVLQTNELGYSIMPIYHDAKDGKLDLKLGAYTGLVFKFERK
ncbi:MAG: glycoside hydrolase family 13 protein, partial [Pseudobutyrivibrio sp.]|nr:glycoside hydrolase family 13 protein [Pseudobutyrivibrio sp.]